MARRIIVYRDYRPGRKGKFVSEQTYNRSKAQGKTRHIHKQIITRAEINSVSDLFDIQDDDDLVDHEYHGTGNMERNEFVLAGKKFQANKVNDGCWMVKQLLRGDDFTNQANYIEAEVFIDTDEPGVAIRAAIMRGSWA